MNHDSWMKKLFVDEHVAFEAILDGQPLPTDLPKSIEALTHTSIESANILDLCCGHGRIGRMLAPLARSIVGVDFSPPLIAKAKELGLDYANTTWIEADARFVADHPQCLTRKFDLFLRLYTSLGYFPYDEECRILMQLKALSAANASLIYDSFNGEWFREQSEFTRKRYFGNVVLEERYEYDSTTSKEICRCFWSSNAFANTVTFELEVYDESRVRRLFADAGWQLEKIVGCLDGASHTPRPWERLIIIARSN